MGKTPAFRDAPLKLQLLTQEAECKIKAIHFVTDASTLMKDENYHVQVGTHQVADVSIHLSHPISFDSFHKVQETGRFVLLLDGKISGGGIIRTSAT